MIRRLCRLGDLFGPAKETAFSPQMHELVLAARQRVAEVRERWGREAVELPPLDLPPGCHSRIDIFKRRAPPRALAYGQIGEDCVS